jgi:hypothetical protein
MSAKYRLGMAAGAYLVDLGTSEDLRDIWKWAWDRYGEAAMDAEWADGFYSDLRSAGYILEGAGRVVRT